MSQLIFDKYEVVRRLALGGMGEVFLARQTGVAGFDRLVILKSLLPELAEQEGFVDQFLDEARVAATLNHPNIVAIYEVGLWNGVYFIAMEYIHGEDLSRLALAASRAGENIPIQVAARIVHDASLGLHHAHSATDLTGNPMRIVHRDISPQNIMVRSDGVTKVVDFGIAKAANRSTRTATGLLKGKLQYMPPEQVNNQAMDGRADQWALGVILWELTCGKRLFKGENDLETLRHVLENPIPAPSSVVPGYPAQLEAVVMRILQRDPELRYPDCNAVANDLNKYLDTCTREVGENTVAEYVKSRMGQELEERTSNLTPTTGTNFLIQLSNNQEVSVTQPKIDASPQLFQAQGHPGQKFALAAALGAIPVALLVVLAWWLMAPPERPALPASPAITTPVEAQEVQAAANQIVPPTPEPKPAPTLLHLESEPSGASVWVGGRLLGATPIDIDALPASEEQELLLTKRGYREHKLPVTLSAGERQEKRVALSKRRSTSRSKSNTRKTSSEPEKTVAASSGFSHLTLQTKPWAKVDIDGEPYGSTPLWKLKLSPGAHTIRLVNEKAGVDVVKKIKLAPGDHVKKSFSLQ